MSDEDVTVTAGTERGSVTITQHLLGMEPYLLIRAEEDPEDGELTLRMEAGGLPREDLAEAPGMLLSLAITSLPPTSHNPLADAFRDAIRGHEEHATPVAAQAVRELAEEIGLEL